MLPTQAQQGCKAEHRLVSPSATQEDGAGACPQDERLTGEPVNYSAYMIFAELLFLQGKKKSPQIFELTEELASESI